MSPRAVEAQVLDRIVDLQLPPGSVLNERALADELGLGHMPVREAIECDVVSIVADRATASGLSTLPARCVPT